MSYTSWTNHENPDKWPEPPKGYYYMPAEDDIITLRTVNGEIVNDVHKTPDDFNLYSRIIQDPQRRCFEGATATLPRVGERCWFYLNSDQQPFRLTGLVRSFDKLFPKDGGAEAKVVAVGVIEQTDGQIGKNNLPFRGDGVYTIDLELVNIDDAYGKEEKVWAIVDVKLATMEERGGKNFAAHGWLTKHLPDVAAGVKPNPRQRTW
jgi:hypothetical protein